MAYTVYLDAGHGGYDNGATGYGRKEKDDNLKLTLAVGEALQRLGVDVGYTRVEDVYDSPLRKAQLANEAGADLFVSIHRNASTYNNRYDGVQTLLYDETGLKKEIADAINEALAEVGFKNIGTEVRTDLAVLKRTEMPAMLIEAGFIDTEKDNQIFDESFDEMADAIAYAIYNTLAENGLIPAATVSAQEGMQQEPVRFGMQQPAQGQEPVRFGMQQPAQGQEQQIPEYSRQAESGSVWEQGRQMPQGESDASDIAEELFEESREDMDDIEDIRKLPCFQRCLMECREEPDEKEPFYQIQTGLFRNYRNAANMKRQLERRGFPAIIQLYKDFFAVRTGYYDTPARARQAEERLKKMGYDTLIITVK